MYIWKLRTTLLTMGLLSLSVANAGASVMPEDFKHSKKWLAIQAVKFKHSPLNQTLMASQVPGILRQSHMTKATGHQFYDTPVHLIDDQGKTISASDKIEKNQAYQIVNDGDMRLTVKNIWFFSPEGTEQFFDGVDDSQKCTAEKPCLNINQNIVDAIHQIAPGAKLWAASGTYILAPVAQGSGHPQILELHDKQYISGRTSNFKYDAKGDERPFFEGSFLWNDLTGHGGINGGVNSIRVRSTDNLVETSMGDGVNINLYSTGEILVNNSELLSESADNMNVNIEGENVYVYGTTIKANGGEVYSIIAANLDINNASWTIDAERATGLFMRGEVKREGYILMNNIDLNIKAKKYVSGFLIRSCQPFLLDGLNMNVYSGAGTVTGILADNMGPMYLFNSSIRARGRSAFAIWNSNESDFLLMDSSRITAVSKYDMAIGIITPLVTFAEGVSHIYAAASEAPLRASAIYNTVVENYSKPASLCSVNDEPEQDCKTDSSMQLTDSNQFLQKSIRSNRLDELKNLKKIKR